MPGVGTATQKAAEYWDKMTQKRKYDAYLIFANGRFTENAGYLAAKVHTAGKMFFFVRAKIDLDLSNAIHDQGLKSFTSEQEQDELLKI